jgi:hypothetical protein
VKLDFDHVSLDTVRYWARRTMHWYDLNGFVILASSPHCFHVVFDHTVTWTENVKIMAWVALLTKHRKLTGWFIMQCIKQGSTLRVSPKQAKPTPRIVDRAGFQNAEIRAFLRYRAMILEWLSQDGDAEGTVRVPVRSSTQQIKEILN